MADMLDTMGNNITWAEVRRNIRQDRLALVEYGVEGWEAWGRVQNLAFRVLAGAELDVETYQRYCEAVVAEKSSLVQRLADGEPDW